MASTGSRRRKINFMSARPANALAQLCCFELGLMVADLRHAPPDGKESCPPQRLDPGPRSYMGTQASKDPFLSRPLHRLVFIASII